MADYEAKTGQLGKTGQSGEGGQKEGWSLSAQLAEQMEPVDKVLKV